MARYRCNPWALVPKLFALGLLLHHVGVAGAGDLQFNRDIRPLLSENCVHCHGPDDANREADLRLDTEAGIRDAFGGGAEDSEAWRRIQSDDVDEQMPPPESHKELKPEEIKRLGLWIDQGAPWQGHWSFNPIVKPRVPDVTKSAWGSNPIDAFVLSHLRELGHAPNQEADRERLLRRVTFAITGLPPTIEEMDAFLADQSADAYESVVDRLLESSHFGERMALMWMDAARYGDTSVFHADGPRDMWPWRDWVIAAYNDNMPFDEFTRRQIAGDLIPDATADHKIATGFLRNNATTDEGGAIAEEFRVEYAVDRVATVSKVWMGLSMECAQCHNHKYDPISQEDYYSIFAYFNQASDPGMQSRRGNQTPIIDLFDEEKLSKAESLKPEVASLKAFLETRKLEAKDEYAAWLAAATESARDVPPIPDDHTFLADLNEEKGRKVAYVGTKEGTGELKGPEMWASGRDGNAFKCNGKNYIDFHDVADFERDESFSYGCWVRPEGNPSGAPLAKMNDGNGHRGYDMLIAGGVLQIHIVNQWPQNAIKVKVKKKVVKDKWQHLFVTYDGSSKAQGVTVYIDGKAEAWDIEQDGLSESIRTKIPLRIGRRNPGGAFKGLVDGVKVFRRALAPTEVAALAGSDPVRPLLLTAEDDRSDEDNQKLVDHFFSAIDKPFQETTAKIASLQRQIADLSKPYVNVMVMKDVDKMRPTFVLDRGNYDSPDKAKEVRPNVPSVLPALAKDSPANRLGLAQWLVRPDHPLTARVTVNRYWALLMGEGIVRSLGDFGAQGTWPTHPDLLDWLAADFIENGWNIKRTIKQIVMSSTYRQSSRVTPEKLESDPLNWMLTRGPRYRLQGEFIRDNALSASGLLVKTIGGPGVKPYQPPGLWNEVSLSGNVRFVQDKGEKLYRRAIYTYWKRSSPAPALTTFDCPSREKSVLKRSRTNTPLQALVTMNDVQFVEAARMLAARVMHESEMNTRDRIVLAFRLAAGVRPADKVLGILESTFDEELEVFQADQKRAEEFLSVGESTSGDAINKAQLAAMAIVTSIILNLDEVVTLQ